MKKHWSINLAASVADGIIPLKGGHRRSHDYVVVLEEFPVERQEDTVCAGWKGGGKIRAAGKLVGDT
jgi:hypothetical protein